MTARKIILDCDPGHDDAIAMLLAHGSPEIELVAVTTVAGNASLANVTRNALSVARIAGITGIPFAAGAARPLVRRTEFAPTIHGDSGLDGPELPEPEIELDPRSAAQLIIDLVMAHEPGEITLVPTGALTNIALAARLERGRGPHVGRAGRHHVHVAVEDEALPPLLARPERADDVVGVRIVRRDRGEAGVVADVLLPEAPAVDDVAAAGQLAHHEVLRRLFLSA